MGLTMAIHNMGLSQRNIPIFLNLIGSVLLGLVAIKLIQKLVPTEVNGLYSLFIGLTLLGQKVTHAGITNHAARFWQRESAGTPSTYLRFLWKSFWQAGWILGALLAFFVICMVLFKRDTLWISLFPILFLGACGMAVIEIAVLLFNAAEKHWMIFLLRSGGLFLRILIPLGLAFLIAPTIHILGAGFALHGLVISLLVYLYFRPQTRDAVEPEKSLEHGNKLKKELRDYGRPFVFLGVGSWVLEVSDRYVIQMFFGDHVVGNFDIANRLSTYAVALVFLSMMQGFFPHIFKMADQARSKEDWKEISRRCDKISVVFAFFGFASVAVLHTMGPYLKGWLINENYATSITMILPAGLAAMATQINQFHFLLLQGQRKSGVMVRIMMTLAAAKLAGGIITSFFSWEIYQLWLSVSFIVIAWIGRSMIHFEAFKHFEKPAS